MCYPNPKLYAYHRTRNRSLADRKTSPAANAMTNKCNVVAMFIECALTATTCPPPPTCECLCQAIHFKCFYGAGGGGGCGSICQAFLLANGNSIADSNATTIRSTTVEKKFKFCTVIIV